MIKSSTIIQVADSTQVAEARRAVAMWASETKMPEAAAARASVVVTELATNLVKHAKGGSILLAGDEDDFEALTLIAIDEGPGIANLREALEDGYSTAGSPGTGLGAVRRMADHFDVYSLPDKGTAVACRIESTRSATPPSVAPGRIRIGGVCIAKGGEYEPGDSWGAVRSRDVVTIMVADGLGHGSAAAVASLAAVRVLHAYPDAETDELIQRSHEALRATRGAAIGIARIHASAGRLEFNGVGNIAGSVISEDTMRKTVSNNGTVGAELRRVGSFSYPWQASSTLVLHSDGIGTAWNPKAYPGLFDRDPALIAAVLFRDYARGNDDATVVVAKAT